MATRITRASSPGTMWSKENTMRKAKIVVLLALLLMQLCAVALAQDYNTLP